MRGKKKRMTSLPLSEMDSTQIYQPELLFLLASLCFRAPPAPMPTPHRSTLDMCAQSRFSQGERAPRKRKSNVYRYIIIWITEQLTSLLLSTGVCQCMRQRWAFRFSASAISANPHAPVTFGTRKRLSCVHARSRL